MHVIFYRNWCRLIYHLWCSRTATVGTIARTGRWCTCSHSLESSQDNSSILRPSHECSGHMVVGGTCNLHALSSRVRNMLQKHQRQRKRHLKQRTHFLFLSVPVFVYKHFKITLLRSFRIWTYKDVFGACSLSSGLCFQVLNSLAHALTQKLCCTWTSVDPPDDVKWRK